MPPRPTSTPNPPHKPSPTTHRVRSGERHTRPCHPPWFYCGDRLRDQGRPASPTAFPSSPPTADADRRARASRPTPPGEGGTPPPVDAAARPRRPGARPGPLVRPPSRVGPCLSRRETACTGGSPSRAPRPPHCSGCLSTSSSVTSCPACVSCGLAGGCSCRSSSWSGG